MRVKEQHFLNTPSKFGLNAIISQCIYRIFALANRIRTEFFTFIVGSDVELYVQTAY